MSLSLNQIKILFMQCFVWKYDSILYLVKLFKFLSILESKCICKSIDVYKLYLLLSFLGAFKTIKGIVKFISNHTKRFFKCIRDPKK